MAAMFLVGFFQSLFFSLLLFLKPGKSSKDRWLALFFLNLCLQFIFLYSEFTDFFGNKNFTVLFDMTHWTLIGPLLFLYVRQVIYPNRRLRIADLVHLMPLALVLLIYGDYILTKMGSIPYEEYSDSHRGNPTLFFGGMVWGFSCVVYYILTSIMIYRHRRRMANYFSSPRHVGLKWLNYLTQGFGLFLLLEVLQIVFASHGIRLFGINLVGNSWIILIAYVFAMGLIGLRQPGIFTRFDPADHSVHAIAGNLQGNLVTIKYLKSKLPDDEKSAILGKLQTYMEKDKPWLDCELDIKTVADAVDTSIHKLSQVINQSLNKSYYDFVNEYRIGEVKKQLQQARTRNLKIIAVAYDCGFNSKSAFYEVFKKSVGQTPSEFRKQIMAG
ncbi:MAG: AraC family transcriptional regulator [Bacteroidota bacterium]